MDCSRQTFAAGLSKNIVHLFRKLFRILTAANKLAVRLLLKTKSCYDEQHGAMGLVKKWLYVPVRAISWGPIVQASRGLSL